VKKFSLDLRWLLNVLMSRPLLDFAADGTYVNSWSRYVIYLPLQKYVLFIYTAILTEKRRFSSEMNERCDNNYLFLITKWFRSDICSACITRWLNRFFITAACATVTILVSYYRYNIFLDTNFVNLWYNNFTKYKSMY